MKKYILNFLFGLAFFSLPGFSVFAQSSIPDESSIEINLDAPVVESVVPRVNGFWVFVRMVLVLAIVVAAIYFIFKLLRKGGETPVSDDPFLRKVADISVGPGKSVQVVTLIDKAYIIGVSDHNVSLLKEIDDKELINAMNLYADRNSPVAKPRSFSDILEIFLPTKAKDENFSDTSSVIQETSDIIESLKSKRLSGE